MASSGKPPATMSSRLATMKFMQRAAAASPASSAASTPDHRSAKRQRLSNGSFRDSPAGTPSSDSEAVQQVLAAEDRKRQEAIDREAARRGETKWVLDVKTPSKAPTSAFRIVTAGYSSIDAREAKADDSDEDSTSTPMAGRLKFGSTATLKGVDEDESAGSDDEAAEARPISDGKAGEAARQKRDAKRRSDLAESSRLASERRSKQLNLNRPTSISGGGQRRSPSNITCHECGETGHIKAKCPHRRR